jgi:hypothetical protein
MSIKELAVTVDERLDELQAARWQQDQNVSRAKDQIRRATGQRYDYRTGDWDGTWEDALETAQTLAIPYRDSITNYNEQVQKLADINTEIAELREVYAEFQWTRAYLVINSNGHIHSSTYCSTCFDTTTYEWLTAYSADPEESIVAAAGEMACTICYPSAPADILNQPCTIQSKNRAEREAAKAERAEAKAKREAKRIASAPTASGDSIFIPSRWSERLSEVKTERTAVSAWYSAQDDLGSGREDVRKNASWAQKIIEEALAGKRGISEEQVREDLFKRYMKRSR